MKTENPEKPCEDFLSLGAVLAGGESRRMGRDKALLELDGEPLVLRAARSLAEVFSEVVIVSPYRKEYSNFGVELVEDSYRDCGPLAGLHAALVRAGDRPIFALACDYPLVNSSLIRHLVVTKGKSAEGRLPHDRLEMTVPPAWAKVACWRDSVHPLCGLYSARCRQAIDEYLAGADRSVLGLLGRIETQFVDLTNDLPFWRAGMLTNLNRPEDLVGLSAGQETVAESFRANEDP